jgi:tetratricopeptide (TPR) repeat protein
MTEKRPTLLIRGLTVRGSRLLAKGRYDQALGHFDRAIELDPDHALAFAYRGETFRAMGRYGQALTDFNHAIQLNPGDDDYIRKRAEIQRHIGPAEPAV